MVVAVVEVVVDRLGAGAVEEFVQEVGPELGLVEGLVEGLKLVRPRRRGQRYRRVP